MTGSTARGPLYGRRRWLARGRPIARVVVVALAATFLVPGVAPAQETGSEETGSEEAEPLNAVSLKVGWSTHLLRERDSAVAGEPTPEVDQLGGFVLSYARVLVPGLLLTVAKPFFFGQGRFDSPLQLTLSLGAQIGRFELSAGLGPVLNLRVFEGEREQVEGRRLEVSLGLAATAAVAYRFDLRWFLELEAGYAYQVGDPVVSHEIELVVGPGLRF